MTEINQPLSDHRAEELKVEKIIVVSIKDPIGRYAETIKDLVIAAFFIALTVLLLFNAFEGGAR